MIVQIERARDEYDSDGRWIVREVRLENGGPPIRGAIQVDDRIVELWRKHLAWYAPLSTPLRARSGTARMRDLALRSHRADDAVWRMFWTRLHAAIAATDPPVA